jgi:TPR repeat protein
VNVEGMILAEATSALVVESATDRQGAGTTTEHNALTYRPAALHPPVLPLAELPDPHIENLLAAGQRYLAQGNVAAARAFFRRAAEAGVAAGATLLATTYDPVGLKRLNVVGLVGDRNEALRWYERARELGAPDDPFRVTGCKC